MSSPWSIYGVFWQNGSVLTTQQLHANVQREDNIRKLIAPYYSVNKWGITNIKLDLNKLNEGIIVLEQITCVLPNGQPFVYSNQWQDLNGDDYLSNKKSLIYPITISLIDYGNLISQMEEIHVVLSLSYNSFAQQEFFTIVEQKRDVSNSDDINSVAYTVPKALLSIKELNSNLGNFMPILKIGVKNGVFKQLPYQYPIPLVNMEHRVYQAVNALNDLIKTTITHIKNDHSNEKFQYILPCLISNLTVVHNGLRSLQSEPQFIYYCLLKMVGELEGLTGGDINNYQYNHYQILQSIELIINRIKYIVENIYSIGTIIPFIKSDNDPSLYNLSRYPSSISGNIHVNLQCDNITPDRLKDWMEESIVCINEDLQNNKNNKTRGLDRKFVSLYTNPGNTEVSLKYSVDLDQNTLDREKKLLIYNPKIIENLKLDLILQV